MGHIAHLRHQFKSFMIISKCCFGEEKNISLFKIKWPLFVKPSVPFTQGFLKPNLVEIDPTVLGKKIFRLCECIFVILIIISSWNGTGPFIWKKLNPLSLYNALCHFLLKLAQWFWKRRLSTFVKIFSLGIL